MTERYKIRIIDFYSIYFIVLSLFSSMFDSSLLLSWLRLLLLLVIPLPFLFCSKKKQKKLEKKKLPTQSVLAITVAGFCGASVLVMGEDQDNFWLSCFFFVAAIFMYFVAKHMKGRYILLYCNPNVSSETKRRFGKYMRKYLAELAAVSIAMLMLMVAVAWYDPGLPIEERQKTNTVQQETDRAPKRSKQYQEEMQKKIREQEESKSTNLFLLILRYILLIAIVAMGVTAVAYGLFRFLYYLIKGRRRAVWEFEEIEVEKNDVEAYTRLVPVMRKEPVFPNGNDGKIRKQFYREVRRQSGDKEIVRSHTPTELKESYLSDSDKDALLTKLYEKAHYAEESVTEEEIRRWERL